MTDKILTPAEVAALSARLRVVSKEHDRPPSVQSMQNIHAQEACDEAADALTTQAAEIERLRAALREAYPLLLHVRAATTSTVQGQSLIAKITALIGETPDAR